MQWWMLIVTVCLNNVLNLPKECELVIASKWIWLALLPFPCSVLSERHLVNGNAIIMSVWMLRGWILNMFLCCPLFCLCIKMRLFMTFSISCIIFDKTSMNVTSVWRSIMVWKCMGHGVTDVIVRYALCLLCSLCTDPLQKAIHENSSPLSASSTLFYQDTNKADRAGPSTHAMGKQKAWYSLPIRTKWRPYTSHSVSYLSNTPFHSLYL